MKILTEYNNINLHDQDIIRAAKKEGARENAIETAKKFLAMGLSVEQVAQGTRLSVEDIQNLVKEKNTDSIEV